MVGVTFLAPMKRGLKETGCAVLHRASSAVTFLAPMKRGLKAAIILIALWILVLSNIPCPDEKGTESVIWGLRRLTKPCNIPCPDEKGTESLKKHGNAIRF